MTGQASAAAAARFQAFLLAALDGVDRPLDAAVRGAVSMYDFAQDHPADARLLAELDELNRPVAEQLAALSRRLFGNSGPTALARTTFAVVDIPHGAVRRHLLAGTSPPRPAGVDRGGGTVDAEGPGELELKWDRDVPINSVCRACAETSEASCSPCAARVAA